MAQFSFATRYTVFVLQVYLKLENKLNKKVMPKSTMNKRKLHWDGDNRNPVDSAEQKLSLLEGKIIHTESTVVPLCSAATAVLKW